MSASSATCIVVTAAKEEKTYPYAPEMISTIGQLQMDANHSIYETSPMTPSNPKLIKRYLSGLQSVETAVVVEERKKQRRFTQKEPK